VATGTGAVNVDLFDVMFFSAANTPIPTTVVPVILVDTQGNESGGSQNGGNETGVGNNPVGNNGTDSPENSNNTAVNERNDSGNSTNEPPQTGIESIRNDNNVFSELVLETTEWVNPFSDVVNTDWFYDYVAMVHINGLFTGTSASTFSPNISITRAMFARILANLERVDLTVYTVSRFTDVPDGQWYTSAVEWAADMGIVNGYGNSLFGSNDEITREQMAVMLNNYIDFKGITLPIVRTPSAFADETELSSWAADAVKAIQTAGIISGRQGNMFAPKATATRAEVATIFARFIEAVAQ